MITGQELALVEQTLREALASEVGLLKMASEHIIRSGGKRLRPMVLLLSFRAVGGQDLEQAVPMAAAMELLHTASLVHDDINDQGEMRRGQVTVNARWGNSLALLIGDFVFVKLLDLLVGQNARVMRIMADCCTAIVEGETLQMLHQGDTDMDDALYLRIVGLKTAALFEACGALGGVLGGGTEQEIAALGEYGMKLGIAFQIRDDTLDLIGEENAMGKPVRVDLDQGSLSLAVLHALKHTKGVLETLRSGDQARVVRMLSDTGALDYAAQRARTYAEEAIASLSVLPPSEARNELRRLADYAVVRDQ
jgi:geranylgeranyl pyrophosphate synthase